MSRAATSYRFLTFGFGACVLMAVGASCVQMPPMTGDDGNSVESILPANYRAEFRMVRDCRNSVSHNATIRVFVNEIGADAYLSDENPLPEGTLVVKEEFGGTECDNDDDLELWSVMLKREAGFDPDDGDWQWQQIESPDRGVLLNDKATCIACHRAAECLSRDHMCTEP